MMPQPPPSELLIERRRIPRYSCSGDAQITNLPLNGTLLHGTVRDLGLGGCCIENIETTSSFDLGIRTEILVKINSSFFRAMANVKAVRDHSGISVEFTRMSAGGSRMLQDLIADLERLRPRVIRRKPIFGAASVLRLHRGSELNHGRAVAGNIVIAGRAEDALADRQSWDRNVDPEAIALDLFV
jgi:hypothetical protein